MGDTAECGGYLEGLVLRLFALGLFFPSRSKYYNLVVTNSLSRMCSICAVACHVRVHSI
jgi:hypothetical protein